jgi:hypothetical protein
MLLPLLTTRKGHVPLCSVSRNSAHVCISAVIASAVIVTMLGVPAANSPKPLRGLRLSSRFGDIAQQAINKGAAAAVRVDGVAADRTGAQAARLLDNRHAVVQQGAEFTIAVRSQQRGETSGSTPDDR